MIAFEEDKELFEILDYHTVPYFTCTVGQRKKGPKSFLAIKSALCPVNAPVLSPGTYYQVL